MFARPFRPCALAVAASLALAGCAGQGSAHRMERPRIMPRPMASSSVTEAMANTPGSPDETTATGELSRFGSFPQ